MRGWVAHGIRFGCCWGPFVLNHTPLWTASRAAGSDSCGCCSDHAYERGSHHTDWCHVTLCLSVAVPSLSLCRCVAVSFCLSAHNFLPGGTKTSTVGATSRSGKVYFEVFGKASDTVTFAFRTKGSSGSWWDFSTMSTHSGATVDTTGKHTSAGTCAWTPMFSAGDSASRVACVLRRCGLK